MFLLVLAYLGSPGLCVFVIDPLIYLVIYPVTGYVGWTLGCTNCVIVMRHGTATRRSTGTPRVSRTRDRSRHWHTSSWLVCIAASHTSQWMMTWTKNSKRCIRLYRQNTVLYYNTVLLLLSLVTKKLSTGILQSSVYNSTVTHKMAKKVSLDGCK